MRLRLMKPGRCDGEVGVKSRCGAGSSKKLTVLPTTLACLLRLAGLNKRRRAENKKEKKKSVRYEGRGRGRNAEQKPRYSTPGLVPCACLLAVCPVGWLHCEARKGGNGKGSSQQRQAGGRALAGWQKGKSCRLDAVRPKRGEGGQGGQAESK